MRTRPRKKRKPRVTLQDSRRRCLLLLGGLQLLRLRCSHLLLRLPPPLLLLLTDSFLSCRSKLRLDDVARHDLQVAEESRCARRAWTLVVLERLACRGMRQLSALAEDLCLYVVLVGRTHPVGFRRLLWRHLGGLPEPRRHGGFVMEVASLRTEARPLRTRLSASWCLVSKRERIPSFAQE